MEETKKVTTENSEEIKEEKNQELSPTWAEENIQDLDYFIESQGIHIRQ